MARQLLPRGVFLLATLAAFQVGTVPAGSQPKTPEPAIVEPQPAGQFVTVDDLVFEGSRVTGVIVNHLPLPVRDVRLVVGHICRWPSEFNPGEQSPNEAKTLLVEEEIPAGGRTTFSTVFQRPTPPKPGGEFVTNVYVVGFEEIPSP